MKMHSYALALIVLFAVAATSINCVQGFSRPTPTPAPTEEPLPPNTLTFDEQWGIYTLAAADPYVQERILEIGWRNVEQKGDQFVRSVSYGLGSVRPMRCHEFGPGYNRTRVLPAAEIVVDDASRAGVNLVAFVDPDLRRVAYIGFVPRDGVPADNVTFSSTARGVDEYQPQWDAHRYYENVTIVNTGYREGVSLPQAEVSKVTALALANASVQQALGGHQAVVRNVTVYHYETGYPDRYVLAYPLISIDAVDGGTKYGSVDALVDGINDRVVSISRGIPY